MNLDNFLRQLYPEGLMGVLEEMSIRGVYSLDLAKTKEILATLVSVENYHFLMRQRGLEIYGDQKTEYSTRSMPIGMLVDGDVLRLRDKQSPKQKLYLFVYDHVPPPRKREPAENPFVPSHDLVDVLRQFIQ